MLTVACRKSCLEQVRVTPQLLLQPEPQKHMNTWEGQADCYRKREVMRTVALALLRLHLPMTVPQPSRRKRACCLHCWEQSGALVASCC